MTEVLLALATGAVVGIVGIVGIVFQ